MPSVLTSTPSPRTYRQKLKEWGKLKFDGHARRESRSSITSFDSDCESDQARFSRTTASSVRSFDLPEEPVNSPLLAHFNGSQPSFDSRTLCSSLFSSSSKPIDHYNHPLPPIPTPELSNQEHDLPPKAVGDHQNTQTQDQSSLSSPLHSPVSLCPIGSRNANSPHIATLGSCHYCGATKLHSLAAGGLSVTITTFGLIVEAEKATINQRDTFGNTCLHSAAASGLNLDHIKLLHAAGADLYARNNEGKTFLHLLRAYDNGGLLISILSWATHQGLDLLACSHGGKTVLHTLFERKVSLTTFMDISGILRGVGQGINCRDRHGRTAIDYLWASHQQSSLSLHRIERSQSSFAAEFEEFLASKVPDYQFAKTSRGYDPGKGDQAQEVVGSLEQSDAAMMVIVRRSYHEPSTRDDNGRNALHCLASIIRYPEFGDGQQPPSARLSRVQSCIQWGVSVNVYDSYGSTPLLSFLAQVRSNDSDWWLARILQVLLKNGGNPNMRDRQGNTALHLACRNGLLFPARVLLTYFAEEPGWMQSHAIRVRNDAGRSIIGETIEWMKNDFSNKNGERRQCIKLICATGFADDDHDLDGLQSQYSPTTVSHQRTAYLFR